MSSGLWTRQSHLGTTKMEVTKMALKNVEVLGDQVVELVNTSHGKRCDQVIAAAVLLILRIVYQIWLDVRYISDKRR